MIVKFKNSTVLGLPYGHTLTSLTRGGQRPNDVELNLSDFLVDWDDTESRDAFCNYMEHLQKQCNIVK